MRNNIPHTLTILVYLTFGTVCFAYSASKGIIINEIMPNNVNTVIDEDYKFPEGWVELHNTTDRDIDIQGWYLSDKRTNLSQWEIPVQCVIPSHGYKIIYTDKIDTSVPEHIHANINMGNTNGCLYLTRADGEVEDETPRYTDAPINHSYGRCPSDTSSWVWFEHATPLRSNSDDCTERESAPDVEYSVQGGIYHGSLTVKLSAPDPYGQNIRYTLDGSEPTEQSPLYSQPITIDSSTVIKAKIIKEEILSKPSNVNTYIITDREMQLPIISLSLNPEYLWDDTLGIYVEGKTGVYYREGFGEPCNYRTNRRRPLNMEYFVEGEKVVNQLCEARIAGGWPRFEKIKGLKIYAKKRYGNNYFSYKFFSEKESMEEEGYRCIYLRNGGNDAQLTIIKDAFLQKLSGGKVDVDYQTCQPVIVYLNGQYWGIENMREPDNDDYFSSNYRIEDIDLFKNHELKEGTRDAYDDLCEFLSHPDFSHEKLCSLVDVNEFVNYMSLQAFVGNYDWPNNNYVIWRNRDNGKWRWLVKDLDGGFEYWPNTDPNKDIIGVNINPFNFLSRTEPYYEHGNMEWATWVLERILSDPIVQRKYIERIAIQLGDIFHKSELYHVIDSMTSIIADEIPYHKSRWNLPLTTWSTCFALMPEWIENRNDILYGMLSKYYSLGKTIPLTIKSTLKGEGKKGNLFLCGERLYRDRFDGKWFQDDSITIEASPLVDGQKFEEWLVLCTDKGNTVDTKHLYDNKLTIKTGQKKSYSFTAIYRDINEDSTIQSANRIISYFPNPVKDKLYIQFDMIGACHLELTDVTGRIVLSENAISDNHTMNMSGLRPGIYFLHAVSGAVEEKRAYKIIKR
ncbi:MAG: CotH kinase family protein [Paludibacteraceae bacterium]|nr:CotH kinase family protein [Paludibacteraceae bacterium]